MDNIVLSCAAAMVLSSMYGRKAGFPAFLLENFSSPVEAIEAMEGKSLQSRAPLGLDEASAVCERLHEKGFSMLDIFDKRYPALLKDCPDAPILLYIRSSTAPEEIFRPGRTFISVIGTRDLSPYGSTNCSALVETLAAAKNKPCIVSGLAIGADLCAHESAMRSGLPTIAVLPCDIESVYPRSHESIAARIAGLPGSALISEFPPGTPIFKDNFLQRNRIIAGISSCTVLIESRIRGGGMMTARVAAGYGREVYTLPGRINDPRSAGCNSLIASKIAELLASPESLAVNLGLMRKGGDGRQKRQQLLSAFMEGLDEDEKKLADKLLHFIGNHPLSDADSLCNLCDAPYSPVTVMLERMKSAGLIVSDLLGRCEIA